MSMPQFPTVCEELTLDCSVSQILTSIAMEELALSHIINAEGEKIQYVLGTLEGTPHQSSPPTLDELIKINESVRDMLSTISMTQMFLFGKMSTAMTLYNRNKPENDARSSA